MAGHQAQYQRRLPVMVEIGPVHRHQDVALRPQLMRHPARKAVPHVDAIVAEQTVHLLDGVLGHQTARLGQRLADHCHRKRSPRHDAKSGSGQGVNPLGMQVSTIQNAQERTNLAKTPTPLSRFAHLDAPAPIEPKHLRNPRESALYHRQIKTRGVVRVSASNQAPRPSQLEAAIFAPWRRLTHWPFQCRGFLCCLGRHSLTGGLPLSRIDRRGGRCGLPRQPRNRDAGRQHSRDPARARQRGPRPRPER